MNRGSMITSLSFPSSSFFSSPLGCSYFLQFWMLLDSNAAKCLILSTNLNFSSKNLYNWNHRIISEFKLNLFNETACIYVAPLKPGINDDAWLQLLPATAISWITSILHRFSWFDLQSLVSAFIDSKYYIY